MSSTPACGKRSFRRKLAYFYSGLILANLAVWAWALALFKDNPGLLAASFLAYGLGLRHAVDADHIAAIDNVTRKLMANGQKPLAAGLFFALGHSTVVVVLTIIVGFTAVLATTRFEGLAHWGAVIGTGTSGFFLIFIGLANLVVFLGVWRAYRRASKGHVRTHAELEQLTGNKGLLGRLFTRFFALVNKSWHMFPLGLLFGLGFDTATEIGLLSLSAMHAGQGMGLGAILVFPALFAAGMSLLDTTDGALMIKAYSWALAEPLRKLRYNLFVTFFSVCIALGIGAVQLAGLLRLNGGADGPAGALAEWVGDHSWQLGASFLTLFVLSFIVARALYRWRRRANMEPVLTQTGASS